MQMNLSAKRWALCLLVVALGYVPCAVAGGVFIPGVGARGMARGGAMKPKKMMGGGMGKKKKGYARGGAARRR